LTRGQRSSSAAHVSVWIRLTFDLVDPMLFELDLAPRVQGAGIQAFGEIKPVESHEHFAQPGEAGVGLLGPIVFDPERDHFTDNVRGTGCTRSVGNLAHAIFWGPLRSVSIEAISAVQPPAVTFQACNRSRSVSAS
jgi:hypothetical protein